MVELYNNICDMNCGGESIYKILLPKIAMHRLRDPYMLITSQS